jgi:hypothetical protein
MTATTTLPCRGRITEFAEDSGTIQSEHGTRLRFGRTSCSGFEPQVGLDVWVMATRVMPVVGERATLVNLTGAVEAADPAERARQRRETEERMLREKHEANARVKETFLARARKSGLSATWRPGLASLSEVIELPPALRVLSTIDEHAGDKMAARAARHDAVASEIDVDAVFEQHRADDDALVICFGPCVPWPIQDACFVPLAQIDGEEPNLFAIFFHPDLYRTRKLLPVIHWKHDDTSGFVTADALEFIAAVAHGRFSQDGEIIQARPDLARLTGLAAPGGLVEEVIGSSMMIGGLPEFPPELMKIVDARADERRASEALSALSLGDDYAAITEASEALETRYRELGWRYQERHTQFQRMRYFEQ